jgi:hypothetical protein
MQLTGQIYYALIICHAKARSFNNSKEVFVNKKKNDDGEARIEMSYFAKSHILGVSYGNKSLLPEDWLQIIEKLVENAISILKETICKKTINELIFNRWMSKDDERLDLTEVETENWEKLLGDRLVYLGVTFGIIGRVKISPVKGDIFSEAMLVVDNRGMLYLFFVRLTKLDKQKARQNYAKVRECYIISREADAEGFRKSFSALAAHNPNFCQNIVRIGLDPVYREIGEKEKEFRSLLDFKAIRERALS